MRILIILLLFCSVAHGQIVDRFTPFAAGFHADYQAVLDEATTQGYTLPSGAEQITQNAIVQALDDATVWDDIDTFFYFKDGGDSDFKKLDWKDPSTTRAAVETGTALTWASTGVLGDGTTGYLTIPFNPTDDTPVSVGLSDVAIFFEILVDGTDAQLISADQAVTGRSIQVLNNDTFQAMHSLDGSSRKIMNLDGTGHFGISVTGTSMLTTKDDVTTDTNTGTPDLIPTEDFELFRVGAAVGNMEIGYFMYGAYINHTTIYDIMN